jgi:hypothetical protein
MKKITKIFIIFMSFTATSVSFAQRYKLNDIQVVTVEDFKGNKPSNVNGNIAAHTVMGTFYKINSVTPLGNGCMRVYFDVKTSQSKQWSWIDRKLLQNRKKLQAVLRHEQGHVLIGYLFGNELSKRLNNVYCGGNYQIQANHMFQGLYLKYKKLNIQYDEESENGNHIENQQNWNNKLKDMIRL